MELKIKSGTYEGSQVVHSIEEFEKEIQNHAEKFQEKQIEFTLTGKVDFVFKIGKKEFR